MPGRSTAVSAVVLSVVAALASAADDFDAWILSRGHIQTVGHPTEALLRVGSLQKPFLVRAWALSHKSAATPRVTCTRTSGCWRPAGHGTLDLRGALRESCNTFFKILAGETPKDAIESSFTEAGFSWNGEMTDREAIGLPGAAAIRIAPEKLLASYVDLVRTPWPDRDDVRAELLFGLKDSAQDGTAGGLRLRGLRAKTGTVPALDGAPLKTSGFALVLDDAGFAFLGLLRRGTGREAAIRAGSEIVKLRPGLQARKAMSSQEPPILRVPARRRGLEDPVRVVMLDELRLRELTLKNLGPAPVDSSRGFVGPGALVSVAAGDHFSAGQWEIQSARPLFERRVRSAIEVDKKEGPLRLIATMTARNYVNGVLKAELGRSSEALRPQLAAAALRYLSDGPRHPAANVCDSTHCAWFVGSGPVPRWLRPDVAMNEEEMAADLSDAEWTQATSLARDQPKGPDLWSADCGGDPVSPHFIWGGGDRRVTGCPRHAKGRGKIWRRQWPLADLSRIFGDPPAAMDVVIASGQWTLRVKVAQKSGPLTVVALTYDEAHRRLASSLGWDAMPAPASSITRNAGGFVAVGTGFGHRVGLCLAP